MNKNFSLDIKYLNPKEFIQKTYNDAIDLILKGNNRDFIIDIYKKTVRIINNDKLWEGLVGTSYHFRYDVNKFINFQYYLKTNLRIATLKALYDIEVFDSYRDYLKIFMDKINSIEQDNPYLKIDDWDLYYNKRPTIHNQVTLFFNIQLYKKSIIQIEDYIFLIKNLQLTDYGYDHFYDVVDSFKEIFNKKYSNSNELINSYNKKFKNKKSRYRIRFDRVIYKNFNNHSTSLLYKKIKTSNEIFDLVNNKINENNSFYSNLEYINTGLQGVSFSKVVSLQNELNKMVREAENRVRYNNNIPKVNEGWISETELYNKCKNYFKPLKVIQHARLNFLGRQHLDIFIPYYKIALEYQGKQHYEPVDFFGGEETFIATKERDERKRKACIDNGIALIYVRKGYSFENLKKQFQEIIDNFQ